VRPDANAFRVAVCLKPADPYFVADKVRLRRVSPEVSHVPSGWDSAALVNQSMPFTQSVSCEHLADARSKRRIPEYRLTVCGN